MGWCPNCGKTVSESDLFCRHCGMRLQPQSKNNLPDETPVATTEDVSDSIPENTVNEEPVSNEPVAENPVSEKSSHIDVDSYMNDEEENSNYDFDDALDEIPDERERFGYSSDTSSDYDTTTSYGDVYSDTDEIDLDDVDSDDTLSDLEQYRKAYRKDTKASHKAAQKKQQKLIKRLLIVAVLAIVAIILIVLAKSLSKQIDSSSADSSTTSTKSSALSVASSSVEAETTDGKTYYVTGRKEVLKVYKKADSDSDVLTLLDNGAEVNVVSTDSDETYWKVYLEEEKTFGYINKNYLASKSEFVVSPKTYYVECDNDKEVSIYQKAAPSSTVLGTVNRNDKVTLICKASIKYWYVYSKDNKVYGYILKDSLSKKKLSAKTEAEQKEEAAKKKAAEEAKEEAEEAAKKKASTKKSSDDDDDDDDDDTVIGTYYASVDYGYLALRSSKSTDASNEIGQVQNGAEVQVYKNSGTFWYVYVPSLGMKGYVNSGYLSATKPSSDSSKKSSDDDSDSSNNSSSTGTKYYASVSSSYLALRNAQSYDATNEIGKIYNGDEVDVLKKSGQYWYVYVPSLGMKGYVNSDYLTK